MTNFNKIGPVEKEIFAKKVKGIKTFYKGSGEKMFIVSHVGKIDQNKINTISTLIEAQLEFHNVSKRTTKRIFNIAIESLQNSCLHGEKEEDCKQLLYFFIGKNAKEYTIFSGNIIENKMVENLKGQLTTIQNDADLKKTYLDAFTHGELSEKGGAGLGFLTMKLKSNSFDFDFLSLNNKFSFFSIQLKVIE